MGIAQIALIAFIPPAPSVIQANHPDKRFDPLKVKRNDHKKRVYTHPPKTGNDQKRPGIFYKGASLGP